VARTIAIVEDETDILANYVEAFKRQGYDVIALRDRPQAIEAFATRLPDLVILDIGLKDEAEGGFELCRSLRSRSVSLPIIFLTAHDSDLDTISGLRLGADDYITKDVSIAQLLARVAALLRRVEALRTPVESSQVLERGRTVVDQDRMQVSYDGETVALTITEFWLLYSLVRYPGHVKNRDQLMQDAGVVVDDGTITSHVKRMRKKFQAVSADFDCIETVYGAGYRWVCDT
jgi:two-component system, OmpR family, response regulator